MSRFRIIALLALAASMFTSDNLFAQLFPAQSYRQQGARRGALAGAVIGGLVGGRRDRPALGIIVGGATGAIVGQALGQRRDQQLLQQQFYGQPGYYPHQPLQGHQGWQQPPFQPPIHPYQQPQSPYPQQLQPQPFIPQQQQFYPHQQLPPSYPPQQPTNPYFYQGSQFQTPIPDPGGSVNSNIPEIASPVPAFPPRSGSSQDSPHLGIPPLPEIPSVVDPNSPRINSPGPRPYPHGG